MQRYSHGDSRAHSLDAAYGPEVIYPVEHDILYNLVVPWYLLRGVQVDGVWFGRIWCMMKPCDGNILPGSEKGFGG
jgi:hypothetical protein